MSKKSVFRDSLKIVFLCGGWYASSAGNNVIAKQILEEFPYPMTVTMVHMMFAACLLGPALAFLNIEPAPHFTRKFYIKRIIPLVLGKLLASLSSHISIWKVPVSYAHTVKAMMPIFTVTLSIFIMGETYPLKVYLSLVPIVAGVIMATVTELRFDLMGLIAALSATICFALQNIYSKKSMREVHIHHLRLLLVLSQLSCLLLFPFWMYTDVWNIISNLHKVPHIAWLLLNIPLNGLFSLSQNIFAFSMISAVAPVSYSVANVTKRIVIISTSLLLLKNPITMANVCGMLVAMSGVVFYNKVRYDMNKEKKEKPLIPLHMDSNAEKHPAIRSAETDGLALRII